MHIYKTLFLDRYMQIHNISVNKSKLRIRNDLQVPITCSMQIAKLGTRKGPHIDMMEYLDCTEFERKIMNNQKDYKETSKALSQGYHHRDMPGSP